MTTSELKAERALELSKSAFDKANLTITNVIRDIGVYARPSNDTAGAPDQVQSESKDVTRHTRLFDSTLAMSLELAAGGYKSWLSPATSPFAEIVPPDGLDNDSATIRFCSRASAVVNNILASGNFHTEDHEVVLDLIAFGPGCMFVEEDKDGFNFEQWEAGSYAVLENHRGVADCVFRKKAFSARQARDKFGKDMLPDTVIKNLDIAQKSTITDNYVFCLMPRNDLEKGEANEFLPLGMEFAVYWIHESTKTIVFESGYPEIPAIVSRYLKWGDNPYGRGAAMMALADGRQLNRQQERADQLVEIFLRPPLNVPESMDDADINLSPGGLNYYTTDQRISPINSASGYPELENRIMVRKQSIRDAFHLDMFDAISRKTKEMSATESNLIRQESMDMFSPVYARLVSEHYSRVIKRVFAMVLRKSTIARKIGDTANVLLPEVPPKMIKMLGNGVGELLDPAIRFTSRIALALSEYKARAVRSTFNDRIEIAQFLGPSAFDDLRIPEALAVMARGNGLPEELLKSPEEVQAAQQQRAMMEQAQAEAQVVKDASTAVKNIA